MHGKEEINAVIRVLKGNTALGNHTKEFEEKISKMFGKKYGIMVNSGSSANLLAFELLNLPKGSEVITPLLTFATTVAPILQKGLMPVFVDVDPDTYLANIDQVKKAITEKTRAIMIPSLLGNIPNLEHLSKIAKKYKLFLIEDSCDTLGGSFKNRPSGAYSDISTTSFYGSHIINGAGGGGMICVNNKAWAERLMVLRGWGRRSSLFGEKANSEQLKNRFRNQLAGVPYDEKFTFSEVGYNFLPLELSAAFALKQLKRFPLFKKMRQKNFTRLHKFFSKYRSYFILPRQTPHTKTAWLAFPVIIKKGSPFDRFTIVRYLENHNIQTRPVFTGDITLQPGFKNINYHKPFKEYPHTKHIMRSAFVVGCHQGLTLAQLSYLEETIENFLYLYAK
ncbi:MAG: aminotransferase class I/II-fold pyridoxal phosphate-dependent enzyme [Candidatus Staskawiczbacteria bacterium]|nr:aminotransferase class I/II-fold pyridoxal phosphate-dependent enzyme [Candidatus Staskawiczbacteria bacterium]MBI3337224.1 aminotransferase class I/II-fold pyridoxal phosphate-dependent enzyme [Candidatus Staskawiczbacteria bacterium]